MDWKEKLDLLELNKEWKAAIELIKEVLNTMPDCVEAYIRALYLFHHVLLEEIDYPKFEKNQLEKLLKFYFDDANNRFFNNAEYLFFIGKILYIAEWFFGIDDDFKLLEARTAFKMQKKAHELEPRNVLFEWAYRFSLNDPLAGYLAQQILLYEKGKIEWLNSKGFPGKYVLNSLKQSKVEYESK